MIKPIRVLIVDDSALVRQLLREILESDPDICVVGHAADPFIARERIKQLDPDVITLDVEMPRMDGISFLRNLMRLRPMPVVMVSSLTHEGARVTLDALAIGAIDFVGKPTSNLAENLPRYRDEIVTKVKVAAEARVRPSRKGAASAVPSSVGETAIEVIAVGASTGGTEAIREMVETLPSNAPPVVVVQHIPADFSRAFADRLNSVSRLQFAEARNLEPLAPGHGYVAPGDRHLEVERHHEGLRCRLTRGERVNQHRPSVDVLFDSISHAVGGATIAVLLTGMGADGALGMLRLHRCGATTLAQDEQSSVVWGMPREAIMLECVDHVVPLGQLTAKITEIIELHG